MKNIKINLKNNYGFKWYIEKNIFVKGYAFDENNEYYEKYKLVELFENITSKDEFEKILKKINGSFAIVMQKQNNLFVAVDRLRTFPLYYNIQDTCISIVDSINIKDVTIDLNSPEYYEFILTGYTIGSSTLTKTYKQLKSAEALIITDNELYTFQYYKHLHKDYLNYDLKKHYEKLNIITDNFIKRLITSVGNKTIVVPLSGGYDSRYIIAGLKKHNFENVICYTYGSKESFEVSVAKKVANNLGYKLYIVEYNDEKWRKLLKNKEFMYYINYAFNGASLPHIQDFIALDEITMQELIPKDSIIVPGFCGDVLGGSYIPIEVKENKIQYLLNKGLAKYIWNKHFYNLETYIQKNIKEKILNRINKCIEGYKKEDINEFISYNEMFVTEHRLSKFIINALRSYEFFGYEWRMPLWDNELIEYWYKITYQFRIDNKLYNDYLFDNLFIPQKIDFKKSKPLSHNKYLMKIREKLPVSVSFYLKKYYHFILKIIKNNDVNNFGVFGNRLLSDIEDNKKYKFKNINGLFAKWLTEKVLK